MFLNSSASALTSDLEITISLFSVLGFIINWEKSSITPSQSIEYLGLNIDSRNLSFAFPESKGEFLCEPQVRTPAISTNVKNAWRKPWV